MNIRWGETAFILDDSISWVRDVTARPIPSELDISVQVTIPNEFKRRASLTIGITAGIEVDRVSPEWLLKCNSEVDLVVVPSRHSIGAFQVEYQGADGSKLSLQKPLALLPEGIDPALYHPAVGVSSPYLDDLRVPLKNLICVGLGLDKADGRDRKNITHLVEWFCRAFKDNENVGLILKTSIVNGSAIDFEVTKTRIADIKRSACGESKFPKVSLIHGRVSEQELAAIYQDGRVLAMVSLTHGEGFGLPLIEAAACNLPVIATDWSGHLDFLTRDGKKLFAPVAFEMRQIPPECVWQGVMEQGSAWADPKEQDAVDKMRRMFASSATPNKWAIELGEHIRQEYSLEATGKLLTDLVWDSWRQVSSRIGAGHSKEDAIAAMRSSVKSKGPSLVYTMPMSAGDVFLSLSVVAALRKKHSEHRVYFATSPQYFDIVKGNPLVDEVAEWLPWMQDVATLEDVFDEVYTPNLAVQMTMSNWVHKGKGRNLVEEFAVQCGVLDGLEPPRALINNVLESSLEGRGWVAIHSGGQKTARAYAHWEEVVRNIRRVGLKVVQIGTHDDISVGEVDLDLRGKTDHQGLISAFVGCDAFVGIDSYPMHVADAVLHGRTIGLFGSSYPSTTGPWDYPGRSATSLPVLIETKDRHGCDRACYKDVCKVDPSDPCINEIPGSSIFEALGRVLGRDIGKYQEHRPKIGGYTHVLNPKTHGYPFIQSIGSMLAFCNEVVVVDGGSTDGSLEEIRDHFAANIREKFLRIEVRKWDREEPGMDGMQKAFGRAMCDPAMDFLWQQDADEVVHPDDAPKIVSMCKRFPKDVDVVHLPVIELWGSDRVCRTDRHSWKWRLTRNNFRVTHGINIHARQMDPKTGRFFAKKGMSDGCELIDIVTGEHLPHRGFYGPGLEKQRVDDPEEYGRAMNKLFNQLPTVWHYSWADLPRKIRNFRDFWNDQWQTLYQIPPEPRFPDVLTDDDIMTKALELKARGGEHGSAPTFLIEREAPPNMKGWNDER